MPCGVEEGSMMDDADRSCVRLIPLLRGLYLDFFWVGMGGWYVSLLLSAIVACFLLIRFA